MRFFFCILFLFFLSLKVSFSESQIEKADQIYKEAAALSKKDAASNKAAIFKLLKEARDLYLSVDQLTEKQESNLVKINAFLYWNTKFKKVAEAEDVSIKEEIVSEAPVEDTTKTESTSEIVKEKDEAWLAQKKEKKETYQKALEETESYEKKHYKDYYSNMLNYLDLHTKATTPQTSEDALHKTKEFQNALNRESELTIQEALKSIYNYKSLVHQKKFEYLSQKIGKLIKYGSLSIKAKGYMLQLYQEIVSMNFIKAKLIANSHKTLKLPDSVLKDYEGVITKIDDRGLHLLDESKRSFISWEIISENDMLKLAMKIIKGVNKDEKHLLALANFRLQNYSKAYALFQELILLDPKNLIRYKYQLANCEAGHRLHTGKFFARRFEESKRLAKKGQKQKAIDILIDLMENHMNDPLGNSFLEQCQYVYSEVIRM